MAKEAFPSQLGKGGSGFDGALAKILKEVQGVTVTRVAGAAAGTKMDIAAMREEDTILAALIHDDAGGAVAVTDDKANITIQPTKASATITISGNPVAAETVTVNGDVFTWRATQATRVDAKDVLIVTGDNTAMALGLANAINAWQNRRKSVNVTGGTPTEDVNTAVLLATAALGVVTISSIKEGAGDVVTVTGTAVRLAAAGSGTASATLTAASVANNDTFALTDLNGTVITFTVKDAPNVAVLTDVQRDTASDTAMAVKVKNAVNAYEYAKGSLGLSATNVAGVVTIVPTSTPYGNAITLAEASTGVAVSGAALTGGTKTGGIKSTTNLTGKSLAITWLDKQ